MSGKKEDMQQKDNMRYIIAVIFATVLGMIVGAGGTLFVTRNVWGGKKAVTQVAKEEDDSEEVGQESALAENGGEPAAAGTDKGEELGHTWEEATCTEPRICTACGETEGEALGHTWMEATCTVSKTCSVCGETEGEAVGHAWQEPTCLTAKICMVCGETEGNVGDHTWMEATCLTPRTCGVCGTTEGEAGDHIWMEATCSAPKTCEICGETEGDRLFHQYPSGRDYCERCNFYGKVNISEENINYYLDVSFSRIDYVDGHEGNDYYESNNWYTWWHITVSPKSDEYIFRDCRVTFSLCYMPAGEGADRVLDVTYETIQWTDIDNDGYGEHDERYATRPGGVYYPLYKVKIAGFHGTCYIK